MKSENSETKLNTDLITENEAYTNKKEKKYIILASILSLIIIAISFLIYFSLFKKNINQEKSQTLLENSNKIINNWIYTVFKITDISYPITLLSTFKVNLNLTDVDVYINGNLTKVNKSNGFDSPLTYKFNKRGTYNIKFNIKKTLTSMEWLFSNNHYLVSVAFPKGFDSSQVTSMENMFVATNIQSLDMKYLDTQKVTNLRQFIRFNNYDYNYWTAEKTGPSIIDISSFDTSKVTNCVGMLHELHDNVTIKISNKFTKCREQFPYYSTVINVDDKIEKIHENYFVAVYNVTNITKPTPLLNLEGKYLTNTDFDVFVDGEKVKTQVESIKTFGSYNYYLCYTFKTLGMNKVKIEFKRTPSTMAHLFYACFNLVSIEFSETFDSSKVQSMLYMFGQCTSLKSVNVSSLDTSSVGDFMAMFYKCTELTSLDLSNFNTENAFIFQNIFDSMSKLEYLDISSFYSPYLESGAYINGDIKKNATVVLSKKTNGIYIPSGWNRIYKN